MNIKFYKNFRLPEFRLKNLLSFFTRDELVAGLEISDSFIRLAVLETLPLDKTARTDSNNKIEKKTQVRGLGEQVLKKGTIENGEVKDKKLLAEALKMLFQRIDKPIGYVVVSISGKKVYTKVYSFPKTVSNEKIEESMKINIDFQLPMKKEEVYFDWEKIEDSQYNDTLLATIPKAVIDKYNETFAEAELKTVAIEFYGLSIARAINLPTGKSALVAVDNDEGIEIYIVKKFVSKFSRFLPQKYFQENKSLKEETGRIINFFENEDKNKISFFVSANQVLNDKMSDKILPKMESENMIAGDFSVHENIAESPEKWLIAVGAAMRGHLPRSEDAFISLMPMGTEEAYEKQKATSFMKFLSSLVIGLCSFFTFAFIGVLMMMMSIESGFNKRLSNLNSLPIDGGGAVLEQRAEKLNNLVSKAKTALDSEPKWSAIVTALKSQVVAGSGIIINNFSISPTGDAVNLLGVSKNKSILNSFKKRLDDSGLFSDIILPQIGLFQVENIPFSLSFKFKKVPMMNDI